MIHSGELIAIRAKSLIAAVPGAGHVPLILALYAHLAGHREKGKADQEPQRGDAAHVIEVTHGSPPSLPAPHRLSRWRGRIA